MLPRTPASSSSRLTALATRVRRVVAAAVVGVLGEVRAVTWEGVDAQRNTERDARRSPPHPLRRRWSRSSLQRRWSRSSPAQRDDGAAPAKETRSRRTRVCPSQEQSSRVTRQTRARRL